MRVVLCEHVEHVGERGQVVNVAAGYARNFLLPKRLALPATPGNLLTLDHRRRMWAVNEAREADEARALAARLSEIGLTVKKKAGEGGTLYGSVTTSEIAALLAERGLTIDRRRIAIGEPIKRVGNHEVSVRLHREVRGSLRIDVVAEGE